MPAFVMTSPNITIGGLDVGNLPFELNSPNSHAEMGDTRTFSSEAKAAFNAAFATGLIGSFSAIQMIAQVSSRSRSVTK